MGRMSFLLRDSRFWKSCTYIREYTRRHVDLALVGQNDGKRATESEKEKYILVHEMAKQSQDREELIGQLLNVFFAGRDTPAVALSNFFFCLARHPKVWKKIRDEIEGLTVEDLTFERLKSLRYVQHTINEGILPRHIFSFIFFVH
jgi:cytochrome P450